MEGGGCQRCGKRVASVKASQAFTLGGTVENMGLREETRILRWGLLDFRLSKFLSRLVLKYLLRLVSSSVGPSKRWPENLHMAVLMVKERPWSLVGILRMPSGF